MSHGVEIQLPVDLKLLVNVFAIRSDPLTVVKSPIYVGGV